ncbi:hypothetical protein ACHAWF_016886 [Thalassiosira exigua]
MLHLDLPLPRPDLTMAATHASSSDGRKYRMVALDLDGTLLNSSHDVSDATVAHLRRLHAKGFVVSIATGRSAACSAAIVAKLDLPPLRKSSSANLPETPPSSRRESGEPSGGGSAGSGFPLVCTNGARGLRVRRAASDVGPSCDRPPPPRRSETAPIPTNPFLNRTLVVDEELFHAPLSPELTLRTLALAHELGCATNYYHDHHIYAFRRNEDHRVLTRRYATLTGSRELYCHLDEEGEEDAGDSAACDEGNAYGYRRAVDLGPPSKLLILCETERIDEIADAVREELNGPSNSDCCKPRRRANVIRGSPPFFVEVLHPEVHKGQGLRRLCSSLSVPLEEVIAFGDGDNDMEFLEAASRGVAMKNARDNVKRVADELTEWSNDEDGVVRTLMRYEREGKLHSIFNCVDVGDWDRDNCRHTHCGQ